MSRMRPKLTYSNVVSTLCLFLLLGGGAAYAAGHLGKNTVGPKQLKKNSVTTAKVQNEAITGAKVKKGTLTGTQINSSALGTVPMATNADHATNAGTANALTPPEPVHHVGSPGEPHFEGAFGNVIGQTPTGFFKDHDCMVHFVGFMEGESASTAFTLPPGFRPAQEVSVAILVGGPGAAQLAIAPNGEVEPAHAGPGGPVVYLGLDSASFRAATC